MFDPPAASILCFVFPLQSSLDTRLLYTHPASSNPLDPFPIVTNVVSIDYIDFSRHVEL